MSLPEKIYLTMVLFLFATFMVMLATLSWLDVKEDRVRRRREMAEKTAAKPKSIPHGAATQH